MGFGKLFKKKNKLELYKEEEIDELEAYITQTYGEFTEVIHEIVSLDIHVDIAVIPATEDRPFLTLVTMGMGAHAMHVPAQLKEYQLERAELMVRLPSDWNLKSDDENDYWPIRYLKILARLPLEQKTWLGYGHTVGAEGTLSANNDFCAVGLIGGNDTLQLTSGHRINFYTMLPFYEEEIAQKTLKGDIAVITDQFQGADRSCVVDIHRRNYGIE